MLITKVEIRNIKNHAETSFDFNPGVTAICGPNGSGKTTIIESIAWALFDYLDYSRDDFVRRGAKRGHVVVTIHSEIDDRDYQIQRDTAGGYFVYDVETRLKLVEQKKDVVTWLKLQLGIDAGADLATLFKNTIGVPQGTFTSAFLLAPAPRKKVFDEILKVEEYRDAAESLRATQKHLDLRLTEIDRRLAEADGELKRYDEVKRLHDQSLDQIAKLEQSRHETGLLRARAEQEASRLDEMSAQIVTCRREVEHTQIKQDVTSANLTSASESAEQSRQAAGLLERSKDGYTAYQQASQQLREYENRRTSREVIRTRKTGVERQQAVAEADHRSADERLKDVHESRRRLDQLSKPAEKQEQLEARLAVLREKRGQALGWKHSLGQVDDELNRLRQRFSQFSTELRELDKYLLEAQPVNELERTIRDLNSEITGVYVTRQNLQHKQEQIVTAQAEAGRMESEREKMASELARLAPLTAKVAGAASLEERFQTEIQQVSRLRAEVARDSDMITSLESGGICPLLTEKCLNLKPGESLDHRFKSGLATRQGEILAREKALGALRDELNRVRDAAAEVSQVPILNQRAEALDARIAAHLASITKLEAETKAIGSQSNDPDALERRRTDLEERLNIARRAQSEVLRLEGLKLQLNEVEDEGRSKRQQRESLDQMLKSLEAVETEFAEIGDEISLLGDPRSRVAVLQQTIGRESEWQQLRTASAALLDKLKTELEKCDLELMEFATLDGDIDAANRARGATEHAYQAFIANQQVASSLRQREADVEALSSQLSEIEKLLATSLSQLESLESQYDAVRHRETAAELQQHAEVLTRIDTQLVHLRDGFEQLKTQVASLEEARQRRQTDLALQTRMMRLRETNEFIRETLQKAAPYITETYLHSVSIEANQLFREVTGRYDLSLKWENDYEVSLEEGGYQRPFANLSGGEQMAAALAVRLALMREFSDNLSLAFFDEPTANMDEDRRRNLAQQIGRVTGFKQLFIISHDDSFENFTDQVIVLGAGP